MARQRPRKDKAAIGFMIIWIVFWTAGMLIVLYGLGSAALDGNPAPALFMLVWLGAAGFGLYQGVRKLKKILLADEDQDRPERDHDWHDGMNNSGRADRT